MLDFENSLLDSLIQPAYLVTIVTESVLEESIVELLKRLKVKSYRVSAVQGEGLQRQRLPRLTDAETIIDTSVATNLEIQAVVSEELSKVILFTLKAHQKDFSITAYRQKIEAMADEFGV
jgi:nitrogen regulatory protein PII